MIWGQKNDLINNAHQIISNEKIKRVAEEVAGNFWKKYVSEKLSFSRNLFVILSLNK